MNCFIHSWLCFFIRERGIEKTFGVLHEVKDKNVVGTTTASSGSANALFYSSRGRLLVRSNEIWGYLRSSDSHSFQT